MARTGVLIVTTGGPAGIGEVADFLEIANGALASSDELGAVQRRYLAIGGISPVPAVAERVAAALERRLNDLPPDPVEVSPSDTLTALVETPSGRTADAVDIRVLVGMLAARPTIVDALEAFKADGVGRVIVVDLAPFETPFRAASNSEAVNQVAKALGIETVPGGDFAHSEHLTQLLSLAYSGTISELAADHKPVIVFTAEALSAVEAEESDYVRRVESAVVRMVEELELGEVDAVGLESALGVRALGGLGKTAPWLLAYQSEEPVPDAVGPDLFAVIDAAISHGFSAVCVLPIGLAFDEVETMWTLDILAADRALSQGIEFARAPVANDDPLLIEAIETAVRSVL
ncbi:MAG: ferrochelatase [Coriobacteriia bacterium]|nr:ferrochelatase [Coriobacteriia bacterium]